MHDSKVTKTKKKRRKYDQNFIPCVPNKLIRVVGGTVPSSVDQAGGGPCDGLIGELGGERGGEVFERVVRCVFASYWVYIAEGGNVVLGQERLHKAKSIRYRNHVLGGSTYCIVGEQTIRRPSR